MSTTSSGLSSVLSAANTATTSDNSASSALSSAAPSENEFLQLLVAQLQYQDPSQPADGTQFVSELAQFAEVGNTTTMSSDLGSMLQLMQPSTSSTSTGTSGTSTNPTTNS